MNKANQTQVAGDHYKSKYQHWDWVADCDMGYYDGALTKYVTRWRKKNGVQDLEKARHFAVKYLELLSENRIPSVIRKARNQANTRAFADCNELGPTEHCIMLHAACYATSSSAASIIGWIDELLEEARAIAGAT